MRCHNATIVTRWAKPRGRNEPSTRPGTAFFGGTAIVCTLRGMKRFVYPCAGVFVTMSVALGIFLASDLDSPKLGYGLLVVALAASLCLTGYAIGLREDTLVETSMTDALTSIGNRRLFDAGLARELARAVESGMPLAVLALDLDDLKGLNDKNGHEAGDRALSMLGQVLRMTCRSRDLPARIGGDEFAVVMPRSTAREAAILGERIRAELYARTPCLTVSAGAAELDQIGTRDPCALMMAADQALYEAKRAGHNQVVIFGASEPQPRASSPLLRCAREESSDGTCERPPSLWPCSGDANRTASNTHEFVSETREKVARPVSGGRPPRSARR